jgi:hypothetical protein
MLFKKGTNRGEAKGASPRPQHHPRSWLWCLFGGPKDVGPRSRMFYLQNVHFTCISGRNHNERCAGCIVTFAILASLAFSESKSRVPHTTSRRNWK